MHGVAADERRPLGAGDDGVDLRLGVVLVVAQHQLEREPGEPRVGLEPLHPPLPRLFEDPQVVLEDVEDAVAARARKTRGVEPRHEALPSLRDETPELLWPLVLAEEAVVRVEHLVERHLARRRRDRSALRPRLRRARAGGEPEGQVEPVVEDADLALHAHAHRAIGARLADELLELQDLLPRALHGFHTVGPVVRPEGGAEDGDPARRPAHLLHRRDHGRVDRGARTRLLRPRHVDLGVARTCLAHVRLERDLQTEVPGVAAAGQPVDAQVGPVAEDAAAAQGHGEREDERRVLALEVVVDAGLEEEPAQLGERADAAVHTGERRCSRRGTPPRSRRRPRSTAGGPCRRRRTPRRRSEPAPRSGRDRSTRRRRASTPAAFPSSGPARGDPAAARSAPRRTPPTGGRRGSAGGWFSFHHPRDRKHL